MQNDLRRGALFAILAAAAFSVMGVCVKAASAHAPNEVVVFIRSAAGLLTLLPWVLSQGVSILRTQRLGGHLWRASFGVCAMYAYFYGIAHLHLAAATLLTYSMPLFIPFIAWFWINEKPPLMVFPAALVGLIGIGFIVRPGFSDIDLLASLVGISSGVFAACAMVSIRRISDTEPTPRIVFYFAALATLISSIPLLWAWQTPPLTTFVMLIGAGISATVGQLCLTQAYVCAPAARVGPFTYMAVIFSALLAWLFWDESLDRWFVLGSALVIITCIMVGWQRKEPLMEE